MSDESAERERPEKELLYYKRKVDELAGENLQLDYTISGLRHELKQKRLGFALLSELQQSIGAHKQLSSIFEITIRAINSTLGLDKTVVLTPTEVEHRYRPSQWLGFREDAAESLASLSLEFPPAFTRGTGLLVVNKASEKRPLVEKIQAAFDLPYFICLPVMVEGAPIGLLLSGRLKEAKPLYPPLDQGDADTFQAIAGLISASVQNMRVAVLKEMDRLKTEFFANISHEFRTPITLTLGPLEQILAGRHGEVSEAARDQLQVMLRNQERLLGLINQILDLAKLEAGDMQLSAAPMPDMNRFVEERANQFRPIAERRGIELRVSLDPRVRGADLYIDREKFDRLVSNLLSNAVKFTKQGYVEVSTELRDAAFRLTVSDTGIGTRPDQLPHIFDRFRQADGSASREYAGSGIGLALVKEIAALHGGGVTVHSQYATGSSFRVSVPLGKAHLNPAWVVEFAEEDVAALAGSRRVVIVEEGAADQEGVDHLNREAEAAFDAAKPTLVYAEDNRDLRNHVRDLLRARYNVFLAVDGRDGLEKVTRYKPDLILTDQMMPHMSGRALLRAIRDAPDLCAIPVMFLTARAGTEARIESLEAGADDYLAKPFDEAELLARVGNLLRARAQERELAVLNRRLAEWNETLERRVQEQVEQLERVSRLKRFFSPQLAELIVAGGAEDPLRTHRREVMVVFLDLRGFTAFAEIAEPEEVMGVLREYHAEMGKVILAHEGTLERFTGDGMMIFFNDPVPVPNPAERAIRMAVAMRERVGDLVYRWRKRDYELDFGVGMAQGYATIGAIGFEGRWDYGAIGAVTNLASRLCGEARPGQILISRRVLGTVEDLVEVQPVGELALKGFHRPVTAYNVLRLKR
ncbi:MAG: response regulator [Candidatus Rokubacteria bacterium]|nr:response regulator [Candidatus Rokubacteria bacterium]